MQPTEIIYENISAAFEMLSTASNATSEPKLMAARMKLTAAQKYKAFTGSFFNGSTRMIQELKGKPESRANAQHCREAAAILVIVPKSCRKTRSEPRIQAAAVELLML